MVEPIPDGYHSVAPYLMVQGVPGLIDLLRDAFGADESLRLPRPDGTIRHAEVRIGGSVVMMGEVSDPSQTMPASIHLYVEDADAAYERALRAGATSLREPTDEFYGDRLGGVRDPVGNQWWIATHREDVPPEEMAKHLAATSGEQA
ncbi:MAG TPA: VOC family protein [Actinomycetota bacterium]|nr:VOC family protein [Actinomycetota bacterium]